MKSDGMTEKDRLIRNGVESGSEAFTGPYGIQIGVTDYCSYACEFCDRFSYRKPPGHGSGGNFFQLERTKFRALIDDAARMKVEQVSLVGVGEPLLHRDIFSFIGAVKKRGMRCQLTTNGALFTEERVEALLESPLDRLNVSVNAASQETYERVHGKRKGPLYQKLLTNLTTLGERKNQRPGAPLSLTLRYVIYRTNQTELEAFTNSAIAIQADEVIWQNFNPPRFATDLALDAEEKRALASSLLLCQERLDAAGIKTNAWLMASLYAPTAPGASTADYYRSHRCYVGWTYAMILEDGGVHPCCYCEASIGNINDNSFEQIWRGEAYNDFRRAAITLPQREEAIAGCHCFSSCGSIGDNIRTAARLHLG